MMQPLSKLKIILPTFIVLTALGDIDRGLESTLKGLRPRWNAHDTHEMLSQPAPHRAPGHDPCAAALISGPPSILEAPEAIRCRSGARTGSCGELQTCGPFHPISMPYRPIRYVCFGP